jgi:hypothetical protein
MIQRAEDAMTAADQLDEIADRARVNAVLGE